MNYSFSGNCRSIFRTIFRSHFLTNLVITICCSRKTQKLFEWPSAPMNVLKCIVHFMSCFWICVDFRIQTWESGSNWMFTVLCRFRILGPLFRIPVSRGQTFTKTISVGLFVFRIVSEVQLRYSDQLLRQQIKPTSQKTTNQTLLLGSGPGGGFSGSGDGFRGVRLNSSSSGLATTFTTFEETTRTTTRTTKPPPRLAQSRSV